mmetsp:Transcript_16160/g.18115  ORF Transcript_16160/g.18115 Transcript_16160/m.18115 type:complete len:368 (-) Transcript_16160:129-1232(-)
MRSNYILKTAAVVFLFTQTTIVATGVPHLNAEIDPENYLAKEVPPEIARGGIQKLHDKGVLRFQNEAEVTTDNRLENRKLLGTGNLRSKDDNQQRYLQEYGNSYYDDLGYYDDDQVVAEEILTIEYYQDNRFSNPEPVLSNKENPTREASGNRWLYANVPLQPIFGINDLPIEGLSQGFCTGVNSDQNGFCHFTYEFFELQGGAIVVYASLTVEGATAPQGPSVLTVLSGTGEFAGAVGELTLWPVSIDELIIPARIYRDGSLFLGNRNGYEAKFEISLRYLVNPPLIIPVPANQPVAAPTVLFQGEIEGDGEDFVAASSLYMKRVTCPDQLESEYCDCDLDCKTSSARCNCSEAEEEDCCGINNSS